MALTVTGDDVRVGDVADVVRELLPNTQIEVRNDTLPRIRAGYDREGTAREIGFRPAWTLREGLASTIGKLRARHGLPPSETRRRRRR